MTIVFYMSHANRIRLHVAMAVERYGRAHSPRTFSPVYVAALAVGNAVAARSEDRDDERREFVS
jgi:hypothetical protein